jgi:hypothetical protein
MLKKSAKEREVLAQNSLSQASQSMSAIFAQRTEKVKVPLGYDSGPSRSSFCNDRRQISGSA